jgi:ABC-type multidrug transport system ATPase subunit
MLENVIEIRNLKKFYQGNAVLQDVSFFVKRGTIHGFIGPNGAGKTTVIKSLMGGIKTTFGEIYLEGRKINEDNYVNRKIGFMTEQAQFANDLTVEEFCQFAAKLRNIPKSKLENRLKHSDLNNFRRKKCRELSTG